MCGIAGKYNFSLPEAVDPALIKKMTVALDHRGPDDHGLYTNKTIGLGHTRLAIIDLSAAGHQPMLVNRCFSAVGKNILWIVFNGEIYNFTELREGLVKRGHKFKSKTDTEVILHLYEEDGVDCLKKLEGMFALAIWDEAQERLLLARDRLGKKPLVYGINRGSITFASELKAILQDSQFSKEINPLAIHHYLTYQYIPTPLTIFKEIHKLPPAHYLTCERGNIKIEPYWQLSFQTSNHRSLPASVIEFKDIFESAVKKRLVSDVPVGAFLSGGIDSSAVVATMARLSDQPVKTFSIGFEEKEFDELEFARIISKKYRTEHHEWIIKPDILKILPELVWHYNEPFADASAIPVFYLSREVSKHVKVVLNGDGGDESFAGYQRYLAEKISRLYGTLPSWIRSSLLRPLISRITFGNTPKSNIRRIRRLIESHHTDLPLEHINYVGFFDHSSKMNLYQKEFGAHLSEVDSVDLCRQWFKKANGSNILDRTLFADMMSYLPDDLLVKIDIATMAFGLEARSPFLDHKIVEFAATLPHFFKLKKFQLKYFLKVAFKDELPKQILYRRKMGFGVPLEIWFRNDLKTLVEDSLLSGQSVKRGYFQPMILKKIFDEHQSGQFDHSSKIWSLIMLEQWHRVFVDQCIPAK